MSPVSARDFTADERKLAERVMRTVYSGETGDYAAMKNQLMNSTDSVTDGQRFWASYLAYKLAGVYEQSGDRGALKSAISDCRKLVDEVGEDSKYYARSQAIKSLCLGQAIAMSPIRGILLGSRADNAKQQALEHRGDDRMVLLLAALSDYYTPGTWGGDSGRAQRRLLQVIAAVKQDLTPTWLMPEAYAFLALVNMQLNQCEQARAALARARELAPAYQLLNYVAARLEDG